MTETSLFDEAFLEKMRRYLEQNNLMLVRKEVPKQPDRINTYSEWRAQR